jgi:hypothetical protein
MGRRLARWARPLSGDHHSRRALASERGQQHPRKVLERAAGLYLQDHPDLGPGVLVEVLADPLDLARATDEGKPDDVGGLGGEPQGLLAVRTSIESRSTDSTTPPSMPSSSHT